MKTLSGGKQIIFTVFMFGMWWKVKLDSYHPGIAIVDGKSTASIRDTYWVKDLGKISFAENWGYDIQMAIYQEVAFLKTGERLPTFLAAMSKEPEPDIEVIGFTKNDLDIQLERIKANAPRIIGLKNGSIKPDRCEQCEYCTNTKILTRPIHFSELAKY